MAAATLAREKLELPSPARLPRNAPARVRRADVLRRDAAAREAVARALWFDVDVSHGSAVAFVTDGRGQTVQVGKMAWTVARRDSVLRPNHGEIEQVFVEADWRRLGIATALLAEVRRRCRYAIKHSPFRTTSGDAWAQSTGDVLPPLFED